MASTTNYAIAKPDVGGSSNAWGTILNAAIDKIADTIKTVQDLANTMLPKAGGVMTGRIDAKTASSAFVDRGNVSGPLVIDLDVAQVVKATITGPTSISFIHAPTGVFTGITLVLVNGGANVSWQLGTHWNTGTQPALTSAGTDIISLFTIDNGSTWNGVVVGKAFA